MHLPRSHRRQGRWHDDRTDPRMSGHQGDVPLKDDEPFIAPGLLIMLLLRNKFAGLQTKKGMCNQAAPLRKTYPALHEDELYDMAAQASSLVCLPRVRV